VEWGERQNFKKGESEGLRHVMGKRRKASAACLRLDHLNGDERSRSATPGGKIVKRQRIYWRLGVGGGLPKAKKVRMP